MARRRRPLKVYDGDEGWVFIEECSYKLLIETILEEQEKAEEKAINDTSREQEIMEPLALECSNEVAGAGEKSMVPEVKGLITETLEDACCCRDALCAQHGIKLEQIDRIIRSTAVSESKRVKRESETPIISMSRNHCYRWISDGDEHDVVKDTFSVETMEIADLVDLGGGRKRKASNYEILLELWKSFQ